MNLALTTLEPRHCPAMPCPVRSAVVAPPPVPEVIQTLVVSPAREVFFADLIGGV